MTTTEYAFVPPSAELHDALRPLLHASIDDLYRVIRRDATSPAVIAALLIMYDKARTPQVMTYRTYLRSEGWQRTRERKFEQAGRECVVCASASKLQIHHRTYARLGRERLEDLVVLCDDCHATYHGKLAS